MIITGGGTAGHVYPGLAAAKSLKDIDNEAQIYFVGGATGPEARLAKEAGLEFFSLRVTSFSKKSSIRNIKAAYNLAHSILRSIRIILNLRPDLIFGVGGYVSFPAVLAAIILSRPVILHEQNSVLGRANRFLVRFSRLLLISFRETEGAEGERIVLTGNPVRESILSSKKLDKSAIYREFNLDSNKKTLFIFGGSQGAKRINEAAVSAINDFASLGFLQIIHLTGRSGYEDMEKRYKLALTGPSTIDYVLLPYLDEIEKFYAIADLIVCRSGATTIAELTALGLPSILIPYPFASMDHQLKNAKILQNQGAAKVILDTDLNGSSFFCAVKELLFDKKLLAKMSKKATEASIPDANLRIAQLMLDLKTS